MQTLSKLLIFLCALTFSFDALAQQDMPEESLLQVIGAAKVHIPSGRVSVVQMGNDNEIFVQQISYSTPNSVEAFQVGHVNSITIHQEGYNYLVRANQLGNSNRYFADIYGIDSALEIIQVGHGNSIEQMSTLTDAELTIIQIGNGHELIQTRDFSHVNGIRITQHGNGAKAIIR